MYSPWSKWQSSNHQCCWKPQNSGRIAQKGWWCWKFLSKWQAINKEGLPIYRRQFTWNVGGQVAKSWVLLHDSALAHQTPLLQQHLSWPGTVMLSHHHSHTSTFLPPCRWRFMWKAVTSRIQWRFKWLSRLRCKRSSMVASRNVLDKL